MDDIAMGKFESFTPHPTDPALVAYVRAINMATGDQIRLTLTGPQGQIITKTYDPVDKSKAQQMRFTGKKRPAGGWPGGAYQARAEVLRDGVVVDGQTHIMTAQ